MQIRIGRMKVLMLTMAFLVTACGGGGSDSGGGSDNSFTRDMSGTWTGSLDDRPPYVMNIDHDAGSSSGTGTITVADGTSFPISLTKEGNEVTIVRPEVETGCDGTFVLTLTSPDIAEGFFDLGSCGFGTTTTITRN